MSGRSLLVIGTGILSLAFAMAAFPVLARAAGPQEGGAHPKAEAEPGHGAAPAAHDSAPAHGGEGVAKSNPMEVQPSLALWTLVVFLGLFFILGKFAWGPLSAALHHREEHLEHCLLQTEKARNESEHLLAEHRRLMAQADDRVRALIDKAQKDAHASAEQIVKQAQSEAEAARDRAQREIVTARDQALAEIWSQTANVAVSVAGKVLSKQLNDDEHGRLLDLAIKELPAAAHANGSGGASA